MFHVKLKKYRRNFFGVDLLEFSLILLFINRSDWSREPGRFGSPKDTMIAVEILIPVAGNNGQAFSADHHIAFETLLADRFGGWTRLPGLAQGAWIDNGTVYRDSTFVYVVIARLVVDASKIAEVIAFAKAHYSQLAIAVRYLGVIEIV